jgi:hypothetical protein
MTEVALTPEGRPLGHSAEPSERKTGLYVRNVETTRLVRDERGWLQFAGHRTLRHVRATSENPSGLVRRYFPKRDDLSPHRQVHPEVARN